MVFSCVNHIIDANVQLELNIQSLVPALLHEEIFVNPTTFCSSKSFEEFLNVFFLHDFSGFRELFKKLR
jgi:hypothetical protein